MPWRLEQADEFRQEVEQYTDAERVVLADAYQALLRDGPLPHPGSPLEIHRLRDPATPMSWCFHRWWSDTRSSVM